MKAVLDASFMLDFLFPDEQSEQVMKAFNDYRMGEIQFIAPYILPLEVINGLHYAVRARRIDEQTAKKLLKVFMDLLILIQEVDLEDILSLSLQKNLSVYDASYLSLAREKNIPLFTLDEKLKQLA